MAKRKKPNKRALVLVPVAVVCLGAVVGLALLSSKPKEPEKAAAEGDRLMASEQPGMFKEAEKCYMQAMKDASASNDTIKYNKYVLKHAQCQYKQASTVRESNETQRNDLVRSAINELESLMRREPNIEAQRLLCEIYLPTIPRSPEAFIPAANAYIALNDKDPEMFYNRARAYAQKAIILQGSTTVDPAIADFKKAQQLKPGEPKYWQGMAGLYDALRRPAEAEQTLLDGMKANPDSAEFLVAYGTLLAQHDKSPGGHEAVPGGDLPRSEEPAGTLSMGGMHVAAKEFDKALKELEKAREIDPTDSRVYAQIAIAYMGQNQTDKAILEVQQAIQIVQKQIEAAPSGPTTAPAALSKGRLQEARYNLNFLLGNLWLARAEGEKDEAKRKDFITQAQTCPADHRTAARQRRGPQASGSNSFRDARPERGEAAGSGQAAGPGAGYLVRRTHRPKAPGGVHAPSENRRRFEDPGGNGQGRHAGQELRRAVDAGTGADT